MDIEFSKDMIKFEKELNSLDKFAIKFVSTLKKLKIRYSVVSGYVSILFGRSRASEDIDILIDKLPVEKFMELWNEVRRNFECINTTKPEESYNKYLLTGHAIRFSEKGRFIPNIELKFAGSELERLALAESRKVMLNTHEILISPLELQISFKLSLGSEKDIEDARYLYKLFSDKLDMRLLKEFNKKLDTEKMFDKYLS